MDERIDDSGGSAREAGQKLAAASEEVTAEAKNSALALGRAARDKAYEEVENRKGGVASELRKLGDALDNSARDVGKDGQSLLAQPLSQVARFCKEASDTLAQRGPKQLWNDIEGMGRRQPAVFFGVAMAAGFLATRLLRSDSEAGPTARASDPSDETALWPENIDGANGMSERRH